AIDQALEKTFISREELRLTVEDVVLITVNRLAADKGIDKILMALEKLISRIPQIKLVIIGSGYQEKELYEMIKQRGLKDYVRHFKNVSENDLYKYYKASDIYISAFSFLGSSISTLEAMACSLPVITTAQPWLVNEGQNGIVLNSNDPKFIEEAVLRLVKNNNLEDQGKISRDVVKDFDWDSIAEKALEQYEELVMKKK
ncbi:MAG: glycosyltransferase, partial [Candidatus Omnitrophica bacterium]|nr:glycosyltransferase [Candidatus Omnitrophota bacterium]